MKLFVGDQNQMFVVPVGQVATIPVGAFDTTIFMVQVTSLPEGNVGIRFATVQTAGQLSIKPVDRPADDLPDEILPFTDEPEKDEIKN